MTKTASDAMEPVTPPSAITKVSIVGLTRPTAPRMAALIRPEYSATATPYKTVFWLTPPPHLSFAWGESKLLWFL